MRAPHDVTSRSGPGRLLAAGVMSVVVAATGCGGSDDTDVTGAPRSAPVTEAPPDVTTEPPVPEPPVAMPVEPAPPASTTAPVTMVAGVPVRLRIPSIGVDSELMDLGLQADGSLEVPPDGFPAGWYTGAPTPGELGPAIIAGHVDWDGQPGVFYDLRDLRPGDDIAVTREDGSTARFRVTRVEQFAKDAFPTQAVYGDLDHAGLRLITCGGAFDRAMRSYDDNLVVFAELVGGDPRRGQ